MRAPVSVVIPTLNAEQALPGCLAALFQGVQEGLIRELIAVDGGSSDGTAKLMSEAGAEVLYTAEPSRGAQLAKGCAAAQGDWLLILHADSVLVDGWADVVRSFMAAHPAGAAGYFRLRFDSGAPMARVTSAWANLRSRFFGLPFGDQGLLLPRKLYQETGGFPDQPLMEDVAMSRLLKGALHSLDATITTSGQKYREQGWVKRGARNIGLQIRYLRGASPQELADLYRTSR